MDPTEPEYSASGDEHFGSIGDGEAADSNVLTLRGYFIDILAHTTSACEPMRRTSGDMENEYKAVVVWSIEALSACLLFCPLNIGDFWTMITAGCNVNPVITTKTEAEPRVTVKAAYLFQQYVMDYSDCHSATHVEVLERLRGLKALSSEDRALLIQFFFTLCEIICERRFSITKDGRIGLIPTRAKPNDLICIIPGGKVPYLIRPLPQRGQDYYRFVGEAYIHGLMKGEGMKLGKAKETIRLV